MKYDKNYFELYAKNCLGTLVDKFFFDFEKSESPDWIDENLSHGLEVVQAIDKYEGKCNAFCARNFGKNKTFEEMKNDLPKSFYGKLKQIDGLTCFSSHSGLVNTNNYITFGINEINAKLEKLNKNFTIYKTNDLFIYINTLLENYDVKEIINKIDFCVFKVKFDNLYFFNNSSIYIYNEHSKKLNEIKITRDQLKIIKDISI